MSCFPVGPALCERFPSTTLGVAAKDPEGLFPRPLLWVCYTSLSPSVVSLVSASCRFDIASYGWELEETASLRAANLLAHGLGEHASPLACWRLRPEDLKGVLLIELVLSMQKDHLSAPRIPSETTALGCHLAWAK